MTSPDPDRALIEAHAGDRLPLIAESFARVTGDTLCATENLWWLPAVVLAHGHEEDPVFFYGNRCALDLFEMNAREFLKMPSRLSAEALEQAERARLLERVTRDNFITDYGGVRVSSTGRRFRIERATVWNLLDGDGSVHGQAATFDEWTPLPARGED